MRRDCRTERNRRDRTRGIGLQIAKDFAAHGLTVLLEAPAGCIVNVSSGRGSLTLTADPADARRRAMFGVTYSASKTALNAVTVAFALDLESTGIKVNAAAPGFTMTAMNNFEATRTVEQAARE